jgi:hypothetical protein
MEYVGRGEFLRRKEGGHVLNFKLNALLSG